MQPRVLRLQLVDLRLLRADVLLRDADPELAPAPQREEQRRGDRQPPAAAEAAPLLFRILVRDRLHDVLANLGRRRHGIELEGEQRRGFGVLIARAPAAFAGGEVLVQHPQFVRRGSADGVQRGDRFEFLVRHLNA